MHVTVVLIMRILRVSLQQSLPPWPHSHEVRHCGQSPGGCGLRLR